ncbi:MAG: TIGR03435 family protein [Acidobacteriota bacterium]|nr:TIGR03435 family protein [Acidobacteriota bacterium]
MRVARTIDLTVILMAAPQAYGSQQVAAAPIKNMAADANPAIAVATIKPSDPNRSAWTLGTKGTHFYTVGTNMNDLITFAYGVHAKQIVDGPAWFITDKFDIEGVPDAERKPNREQLKSMLQGLLADRFKLAVHHDTRELAVYALTVAKNGPKLTKSTAAPDVYSGYGFPREGAGTTMRVMNMTLAAFVSAMQRTVLDKPVVDQTGLTDRYDFTLNWTPDDSQFIQLRETGVTIPTGADDPNTPPGLYTAIQEQLGLRLDPAKAMADVIVVDHAEKPSAN